MQKHVNLVDLGESFPTHIYLQNLASIQPRTSPVKFARSPCTDYYRFPRCSRTSRRATRARRRGPMARRRSPRRRAPWLPAPCTSRRTSSSSSVGLSAMSSTFPSTRSPADPRRINPAAVQISRFSKTPLLNVEKFQQVLPRPSERGRT